MEENAAVVSCITDTLRPLLREHERVFLCYYEGYECLLAQSTAQAVMQLGGECISWKGDRRWYGLLRQVFSSRARVLVGSPQLILGLAKIARATRTPLPVRHVLLLGKEGERWLLDGIRNSLDAEIHTCSIDVNAPCVTGASDPLMEQLENMLLSWSSILDFSARQTELGLSLKITVFPGLRLPHLPSGASVTVHPWTPKEDIPCCLQDG